MAGSGEVYKAGDGTWGFRVKSSSGETVATEGYPAKDNARETLQQLLRGDFDGPITEVPTLVCGQEITEDTTLEGDIVCADGPAFILAADNVTLDLGGFTVSRDPGSTAIASGPGILLRQVHGATVQKGTITGFAAGVAVMGGGHNVVQNVTVQDNVGAVGGDFGDGITVQNSSENRIQGNSVLRNGPYSGISLVGEAQRNAVLENIVADNNMSHVGDPQAGRQDMGIRIEGPAANGNRIVGNTVTVSGADGIVILPTCAPTTTGSECAGSPPNDSNEIVDNISSRNGTSGQGSGIRLFTVANPVAAAHTTISGNVADGNVTHGIAIDAVGNSNPGPTENKVIGNSGHDNGAYDGFDGNVRCGTNTWQGNDFGEVNHRCVSGPATPPPTPPTPPPTPPTPPSPPTPTPPTPPSPPPAPPHH